MILETEPVRGSVLVSETTSLDLGCWTLWGYLQNFHSLDTRDNIHNNSFSRLPCYSLILRSLVRIIRCSQGLFVMYNLIKCEISKVHSAVKSGGTSLADCGCLFMMKDKFCITLACNKLLLMLAKIILPFLPGVLCFNGVDLLVACLVGVLEDFSFSTVKDLFDLLCCRFTLTCLICGVRGV